MYTFSIKTSKTPESSVSWHLTTSACFCKTTSLQLPRLFAAFLMSTTSTMGLLGPSKTWHEDYQTLKQNCVENDKVHTEDLKASSLSLTASANPPAISTRLRPQQILCPTSPHQSAHDTVCDITVQSDFLWSNLYMLQSLTETEVHQKRREQGAGNLIRSDADENANNLLKRT